MKYVLLFTCVVMCGINVSAQSASTGKKYVLVIHGGAGGLRRGNITPEKEAIYTEGLRAALNNGKAILEAGGTALDAVEKVIMTLENDSMFNAGKGAVYANNKKNELDASIMDGKNLNAGAVAGVTTIKSPIHAARMVMEKSPHVMLAREGAEAFAKEAGCEIVDPSYFRTEQKYRLISNQLKEEEQEEMHKGKKSQLKQPGNIDGKYGTVGAVALDMHGNLAAGTSTGGMSNKKWGRVGDSPIIGAGTYADNNSCAVSCTGWGEYYIRLVLAKAVCDRVELKGQSVDSSVKEMIYDKLANLGGDGGIIAVDKDGNIAIEFNTAGMFRAYVKSSGESEILMYKD